MVVTLHDTARPFGHRVAPAARTAIIVALGTKMVAVATRPGRGVVVVVVVEKRLLLRWPLPSLVLDFHLFLLPAGLFNTYTNVLIHSNYIGGAL